MNNANTQATLDRWHRAVATRDATLLDAMLADDVVFHSPVVHTPQRGKPITKAYLAAALQVFGQPSFRYVRQVVDGNQAVLEFELELDGVHVNGVDIIGCDDAGCIVDFKVMLRPLKALEVIRRGMEARLMERG